MTGGSRGLGKAIAQRLAAEGATVAITARTMEPDEKYVGSLRETEDEITAAGGRALAVQADLSQGEDRERLVAEVIEELGSPDILVNNAAVTFLRALDEFPERRVKLMFEMHVFAPLHLTQLVLPGMRERKRGWICNMTSVAADHPPGPPFSDFDTSAGFGVYGMAKAAQNRLTGSLAAELYADGIAVNGGRTHGPGRDRGCRGARPREVRHRGHQPHHRDRVPTVHRRPRDLHRPDRAHADRSCARSAG